jgi:hypothetical protein
MSSQLSLPVHAGEGFGVFPSVGTVGAQVYAAAARLRLLLLRGVFGVHGGLWWRREAGRPRLD